MSWNQKFEVLVNVHKRNLLAPESFENNNSLIKCIPKKILLTKIIKILELNHLVFPYKAQYRVIIILAPIVNNAIRSVICLKLLIVLIKQNRICDVTL